MRPFVMIRLALGTALLGLLATQAPAGEVGGYCPALFSSGYCGDGYCDYSTGEPSWCPGDCGPSGWCGDGICQPELGEDSGSCPWDCPPTVFSCGSSSQPTPPADAEVLELRADVGVPAPRTVYLNGAGGSYTKGPDNSSANVCTFFPATATIRPYHHPERWPAIVNCVKGKLARWELTWFDDISGHANDPGAQPHIEAILTRTTGVELNVPNGGGRADIVHCDAGQPAVNERGVVVAAGKQLVETTGAVLDLPLEQVCLSLAHEIGHALSLDHSSLCSASQLEIMYINGCSPNAQFSNETASCLSQDSVPRSCACSATQNSLQQLDSVLPVAGSSPSTTITSPAQGAQVARSQPFNVRATITTQGAVVTRAVLRWATVTRPDEELTSLGGNVWGKDNVSLDGVPDGEQRLRIIAYDSLDRKKKSKKRTFVVSSM